MATLKKSPLYSAFGLSIASDFELALLPDGRGEPDVLVRVGSVPQRLANVVAEGIWYQGNSSEFLLEVPPVARYLVRHGNEVIVAPAPASRPSEVETFLLGAAFAALLHQRGIWTAHASCIESRGRGVLFAGPSGVGKSSIAATLQRRGYRVVADDVTPIISRGSVPFMLPGQPHLRLWSDVLEKLGGNPDVAEKHRVGLEKYVLREPLGDSTPLQVERMYILRPRNVGELSLQTLRGQAKFRRLLENTYKSGILERLGGQQAQFGHLSALARGVPVMIARRPSEGLRLEELADLLEQDFNP